ncbi:Lactobacillus shifted protein [Erysiphe necator]|nr:Lactobacillus shifted protein [Erysiphe necator]
MLSAARGRFFTSLNHEIQVQARRAYAFGASERRRSNEPINYNSQNIAVNPNDNRLSFNAPHQNTQLDQAVTSNTEKLLVPQAPNRVGVWSKSQNPRSKAMSGPRFEQTLIEIQPAPLAAIELSHKQVVNWSYERSVSCDGGGGPLGHPRVFINIDKPQICVCGYCGRPFASEHHRKHIESLLNTPFPLS